jgi:hypothetical protein
VVWFAVDDNFLSHPKVRAIPRRVRSDTVMAWLACGTWSSRHLTDGLVPWDVVEDEGWSRTEAGILVKARLWHAPGESCDHEKCPGGPPAGHWQFHDWWQCNETRERVLARKAAAARRQAEFRGRRKTGDSSNGTSNAVSNGVTHGVSHTYPLPSPPLKPFVLTLVSRLAAGNAGESQPPAEVIESWQRIAGEAVDLETEAMSYLARYGTRPAGDEGAAWAGWLRKAAEREATRHAGAQVDPDADIRPPAGCGDCVGGWLFADDDRLQERPAPCPTCKPHRAHLRPVGDA